MNQKMPSTDVFVQRLARLQSTTSDKPRRYIGSLSPDITDSGGTRGGRERKELVQTIHCRQPRGDDGRVFPPTLLLILSLFARGGEGARAFDVDIVHCFPFADIAEAWLMRQLW